MNTPWAQQCICATDKNINLYTTTTSQIQLTQNINNLKQFSIESGDHVNIRIH